MADIKQAAEWIRAEIKQIDYTNYQGNPFYYRVGERGVKSISEVFESCESGAVKWTQVLGETGFIARFPSNKLDAIFYE